MVDPPKVVTGMPRLRAENALSIGPRSESSSRCESPADLAGREHWEAIYRSASIPPQGAAWSPRTYDALVLGWALRREIERARPRSVLEIGCGNSTWLGYLAKTYGVRVAGIDYSPLGCALARQRLAAEGVDGRIFCWDMLDGPSASICRHDFVFSFGVVEHFEKPEAALRAALRFVKPGGFLFTEIPNLLSVYGIVSWLWQPADLAKHRVVSKAQLDRICREALRLESTRAYYLGLSSLRRIPWSLHPRWPSVARRVTPHISRIVRQVDRALRWIGVFRGLPFLAPYVVACGRKPTGEATVGGR